MPTRAPSDDPLAGTALAKDAAARRRLLPCAELKAAAPANNLPLGASRFGGAPDLPRGVAWPTRRDGRRLDFLAQLAFSDLARACPAVDLPRSGSLAFFYDIDEQPWGIHASEFDAWKVISVPEGADLQRDPSAEPDRKVRVRGGWSLPSETALREEDAEPGAAYATVRAKLQPRGGHRFLGHPDEVQGSMYGTFRGSLKEMKERRGINPFTKEVVVFPKKTLDGVPADLQRALKSKGPWRLLLQLDSDDTLGWTWGDCGSLYFWIREQDLLERRFDLVWLMLQCG